MTLTKNDQVIAGVAVDNAPADAANAALDAEALKQHAPVNNNEIPITTRIEITINHIRALKPELPFWTKITCGG